VFFFPLQKTRNHLYDDMVASINPKKCLVAAELGLTIENIDQHTKGGFVKKKNIFLLLKDGKGWSNGVRGTRDTEAKPILKHSKVALCGEVQPKPAFKFLCDNTNRTIGLSNRWDLSIPPKVRVDSLNDLRVELLPSSKPKKQVPARPAVVEEPVAEGGAVEGEPVAEREAANGRSGEDGVLGRDSRQKRKAEDGKEEEARRIRPRPGNSPVEGLYDGIVEAFGQYLDEKDLGSLRPHLARGRELLQGGPLQTHRIAAAKQTPSGPLNDQKEPSGGAPPDERENGSRDQEVYEEPEEEDATQLNKEEWINRRALLPDSDTLDEDGDLADFEKFVDKTFIENVSSCISVDVQIVLSIMLLLLGKVSTPWKGIWASRGSLHSPSSLLSWFVRIHCCLAVRSLNQVLSGLSSCLLKAMCRPVNLLHFAACCALALLVLWEGVRSFEFSSLETI
jgi:hypothetical protein